MGLFGPKASNLLGGAIGYDGENIQSVDMVVYGFIYHADKVFCIRDIFPETKETMFIDGIKERS